MTKQVTVEVTPKEGIFDPAGEQALNGLRKDGFTAISQVRIGKLIKLELDDSATIGDVKLACEKLLANPVIEDYKIIE